MKRSTVLTIEHNQRFKCFIVFFITVIWCLITAALIALCNNADTTKSQVFIISVIATLLFVLIWFMISMRLDEFRDGFKEGITEDE